MKNAYLVRGKPSGLDRVQNFLQEGIAAVGWAELDQDLTGLTRDEFKVLLEQAGNEAGPRLGSAVATLDMFVNRLQLGDLILMPDSNDIYLGQVKSAYFYESAALQDGYPHQRKVEWIQTTTRSALSTELRTALKAWRTVANLSRHYDEIAALSRGKVRRPTPSETRSFSFPLREDFTVSYTIPTDMTREEARQLRAFFSSQRAFLGELYENASGDEQI